MYSFPSCELVPYSMSSSNCCFLIYIQVSLHTKRQVRWSDIPTSWRIVHSLLWSAPSKALAQLMKKSFFFLGNSFAFSIIQWMLAILPMVPRAFVNPACTSGSSQFTYCWSLAWRILSITLLVFDIWDSPMEKHRMLSISLRLPTFHQIKIWFFSWKGRSNSSIFL